MAKHRGQSAAFSADQARSALAVLLQEGKLKATEVRKALQRRDRLIRALRASLAALELGAARVGRQFKGGPFPIGRKGKAAKPPAKRRKPRISAATRARWKLQGEYMSAIRQLPKAARAKVKRIRAKSGVHAAIAEAKRMAG